MSVAELKEWLLLWGCIAAFPLGALVAWHCEIHGRRYDPRTRARILRQKQEIVEIERQEREFEKEQA